MEQEFLARQERARLEHEKLMEECLHKMEDQQVLEIKKKAVTERRRQMVRKEEPKELPKESKEELRPEVVPSTSELKQLMANVATIMAPKHPTKNVDRVAARIHRSEEQVKEMEMKRKKVPSYTKNIRLGYEECVKFATSAMNVPNQMEPPVSKSFSCSTMVITCPPERVKEFHANLAREKTTLEEIRKRVNKAFEGPTLTKTSASRTHFPSISHGRFRFLEHKPACNIFGIEGKKSTIIPGPKNNRMGMMTRTQPIASVRDRSFTFSMRKLDSTLNTSTSVPSKSPKSP